MVTLDFSKCKTREDVENVFAENKNQLTLLHYLKIKLISLEEGKKRGTLAGYHSSQEGKNLSLEKKPSRKKE